MPRGGRSEAGEVGRRRRGKGGLREGGREGARLLVQTPLCVANHLGWLDILVLLASLRCTFVAQEYVERTPIVGTVGIVDMWSFKG